MADRAEWSSAKDRAVIDAALALSLAFQIAAAVLDATATTDQLGKTAGWDVALHKSTYPALLGVRGAATRADAVASEARLLTPPLERLARFAVERQA